MSRAKPQPPLAWRNVAQHVYRPEPARGVPLVVQAVIAIAVIVGFCLIVQALGGGAG